jgi:hypothetical protein
MAIQFLISASWALKYCWAKAREPTGNPRRQKPAVSLLLNLEAARQGRSMLFSDEQKLLFDSGEKGFVKNSKLDFMRR